MKKFLQYHVGSLVAWVAILIIAFGLMPSTSALVRDKGATKVPSDMQSQVATAIQNKWGHGQNNTRQVAVVFSNGNQKLSASQKAAINATITKVKDNKAKYHVKSILAPTDNAETKKQLVAKDGTTQIMQLMVGKNQTVRNMTDNITKAVKTTGVKTYVTGGDILNDDFSQATEEGIKKTEVIAAIFIFIVLIIVFRSPIVPLVSLSMVGVALLTSLSLVFNLSKWFNFPLSSFTQVFIVVILFGIGTDYNILLYDQFKASLSHGHSKLEATKRSRKVAGRTILYSGSSVLIGFSALGLANFSIYKSAVGVAVGVAVLLLVLLTLNPFFMAVLGKKMFWPIRNFEGASHSKLWNWLSAKSVLHPLIALGITALCAVPLLMMYSGNLNYDTVDELADSVPAKQGFQIVQKHFSKGMAEPSTLYIRSDKKLDKNEYLKTIDQLTRKLKKDDGIKTVASVTQPGGTEVSDLYVKKQLKTVTSGMVTAHKGLGTINKGLTSAEKKLAAADMQSGLTGVKQLINGTDQLITGANSLQSGAGQLNSGAWQLANGLDQYTGAVTKINNGANQLAANSPALRAGVQQLITKTQSLPLAVAGLDYANTTIYNSVAAANQQLGGMSSQLAAAQSVAKKLPALTTQINSMKTQLAQLDNLDSEITSAKTLLANLKSARSEITGLTSQASDLESALSTVKSSMSSMGSNDYKALAGDKEILEQANAIINDSTASTASVTAAKTIAAKAQDNIDKYLGNNQTTLSNLLKTSATLKLPDMTKLKALVDSLPSDAEIDGLTSDLAKAQNLMTSAKSLLASTDSLTSSASDLASMLDKLPAMLQQLQALEAGTKQAMSIAQQLNSGVNGSGVNTASATTIAQTIKNSAMTTQLATLQSGLGTYVNGVDTLASGTKQVAANSSALTSGANSLLAGTTTLNNSIPSLTSGLYQVNAGQKTMYTTLAGLVGQMGTLQSGLKAATNGLGQIDTGVLSANDYLTGLRKSASTKEFYIPSSVLRSKTFKPALKQYLSADKKATQLTIVFKTDPSSAASLDKVNALQKEVKNQLKGTPLEGATVAIGGQTAFTADTRDVASSDFLRTAAIMLIGIALALMVITRSILQPLYIMGTLVSTYFSSLTITRLVSHVALGQDNLTWNTPFFAFIMLVALGVDYSIFLMMKYREFGTETPGASITRAAGIIGAVVISAAIILGGTFAALMPSGVLTLIQVALAVMIGLVILVILLPITISAGIRLTYDRPKK